MNVFLTGATGYVGHQLALALANKDYKVQVLVRNLNSNRIPKHNNIKVFKGDICNYDSILKAMQGCEYVFHTAAYTNLRNNKLDDFYNTNVTGTENVLSAAVKVGVKKVIYTSTLAVYGASYKNVPITELQPRLTSYTNDYELTKSMSEEVVASYVKQGLPCAILNVTRVFGPGLKTFSNGLNQLIKKIKNNDFLIVPSNLNVVANYVFIDDVVKAHLLAMDKGEIGERYIVGGENISYYNLFRVIKKLTKSKVKIVKLHYKFLRSCILVYAFLKKTIGSYSLTPKMLDALFTNRISNSQKAKDYLSYKVTPFQAGLLKTINQLN